MAQKFHYNQTSINQWIETEANPAPEKLKERATIEAIREALKEDKNVTVVSAEWEPAHGDWKEVLRVVLSEEGYGAHPATIQVFCPLDWNGRFLACTGGGIRTHHMYEILGRENRIVMPFNAVANGFATANTDGGVPGDVFSFGLDEETKKIDYELILNLAYRSTHSMTVLAKKVIEAVYGEKPEYCYMQGASGGGRQTLTEVQIYPGDYDGFWSVDPAINWNEMIVSDCWGFIVMHQEKHVITPAKMGVFRSAAIKANGGRYDFIETSEMPQFDPAECVGMDSADGAITEEDARVMKLIFDGPKTEDGHFRWYGFRPGTHFWSSGAIGEQGGGCNIRKAEDGTYYPIMNSMFEDIVNAWVTRDMQYDWTKVDYRGLDEFFKEAVRVTGCMECNNPDLYEAKESGAKILLTHAVNDDTIPSDGTIDYYKRVVDYMGDEKEVQKFLRLFMTPGGGHTDIASPGLNLTTSIGMTALMKWVENGEAPQTMDGLQYDFEQNEPILTGKVSLYCMDEPSKCVELKETEAYAKKDAFDPTKRFNSKSTFKEIQADPEGKAILDKYLGALLENPMMGAMLGAGIGQVQKLMPNKEIQDKISQCMEELFELKKEKTDRYYGKSGK